jgi:hypothetical protein
MWESISLYLERQPQAFVATVIPLAFVAIAWAGIIFVRPFLRLWMRGQEKSNDLITYASAGFSLFYGLLLGLLSVATALSHYRICDARRDGPRVSHAAATASHHVFIATVRNARCVEAEVR